MAKETYKEWEDRMGDLPSNQPSMMDQYRMAAFGNLNTGVSPFSPLAGPKGTTYDTRGWTLAGGANRGSAAQGMLDEDKRYADFRIRLHVDELRQGEFFRAIITGYIGQDEDLLKFVDKYKNQPKTRRKILKKTYDNSKKTKSDFKLSDE